MITDTQKIIENVEALGRMLNAANYELDGETSSETVDILVSNIVADVELLESNAVAELRAEIELRDPNNSLKMRVAVETDVE